MFHCHFLHHEDTGCAAVAQWYKPSPSFQYIHHDKDMVAQLRVACIKPAQAACCSRARHTMYRLSHSHQQPCLRVRCSAKLCNACTTLRSVLCHPRLLLRSWLHFADKLMIWVRKVNASMLHGCEDRGDHAYKRLLTHNGANVLGTMICVVCVSGCNVHALCRPE